MKQKAKIYVVGMNKHSSKDGRKTIIFRKETYEKMKELLEFEKLGKEIKEQLKRLENKKESFKETIDYDNAIYLGESRDGKRHGLGITLYIDESRYEGEHQNDSPEGKGVFYHENGNIYVGEFKLGKKHGKGIFNYANGYRY